ncbi:MAG: DctP family TRAP transporter solute-binding subunit [Candidatus Auribacterota bacterium]|nr:DctP family TRAP transporter solute-binding subunit [Candidatus Auribacterota bacterium]
MKKFIFSSMTIIIAAVLMVLLPASRAQAAKYNFKLAHEEVPGSFMDVVAEKFQKALAKNSNGKIHLDIYPAGTLGTSEDLVELVQQGAIDFNFADAGHLGSLIAEQQIFLLHYFFPKDMEVVKEVMNKGDVMKLLAEEFRKQNLEPLATFTEGWQIWTSNTPLRTPADFNGFKMRVMTSKLLVADYSAYGANATATPFSEVYSGLQLKMIDGQVNPLLAISDMKFYEVQEYLTFSYCNPFIFTMITNKKKIESLPEDIRKIVEDSAQEIVPFSFDYQTRVNQKELKNMLKEKPSLKVIKLTQDEIDAFKKLARPVRQVYLDMVGKTGEKVLKTLENDIEEAMKK